MSGVSLCSATRRTPRINMDKEEEEHGEGRFLSSTPNGVVPPSQRGHSSLYPTSASRQNPLHQGHVTSTGIAVQFHYTSDLSVFDFHLSRINFGSVFGFNLGPESDAIYLFIFCSEIGAASWGHEPRLIHTLLTHIE